MLSLSFRQFLSVHQRRPLFSSPISRIDADANDTVVGDEVVVVVVALLL